MNSASPKVFALIKNTLLWEIHRAKSLKEVFRILKPGGKFFCLEFSQINSPLLRKLFSIYNKIIPKYGKLISNNEFAYEYLIKSIEIFPNQIKP